MFVSRSDDVNVAVGFNPRMSEDKFPSRQQRMMFAFGSIAADAARSFIPPFRGLKPAAKIILPLTRRHHGFAALFAVKLCFTGEP